MKASILFSFSLAILVAGSARAEFRAGAAAVDATPVELPVIQNGGFLEGKLRLVADPLFARAIVVQQTDGGEKVAIVVGSLSKSTGARAIIIALIELILALYRSL